jgi:hypothetical protein
MFRRLVEGWASNQVATMNKEKVQLAKEYDTLEKLAEERELDDRENERFNILENS